MNFQITPDTLYPKLSKNKPIPGFGSIIGGMPLDDYRKVSIAARRKSRTPLQDAPILSYPVTRGLLQILTGKVQEIIPLCFVSNGVIDGVRVKFTRNSDAYSITLRLEPPTNAQASRTHITIYPDIYSDKSVSPSMVATIAIWFLLTRHEDFFTAFGELGNLIGIEGSLLPTSDKQVINLCKVSDELLCSILYGPTGENVSTQLITITSGLVPNPVSQEPAIFPDVLLTGQSLLSLPTIKVEYKTSVVIDSPFVGRLASCLHQDILNGFSCLLTGPTETGKSLCVESVCHALGAPLEVVKGFEGLQDIDIIGALKLINNETIFIDGPLVKAMRKANIQAYKQKKEMELAKAENRDPNMIPPSVLFVDEINRMETRHQNLFLAALNIQYGTDNFYLYIPATGEEVRCPKGSFVMIAARNFGTHYVGINDMDLACVRRFDKKYDVGYLTPDYESELLIQSTGISKNLSKVLVMVADDIRKQVTNLQAPLGTGSLKTWAREVVFLQNAGVPVSSDVLLNAAADTWLEIVVGRDEWGTIDTTGKQIVFDNICHRFNEVMR